MADTSPNDRFHNRSGSAWRTTAKARPASSPPPRPCSVRPASSTGIVGAAAATRLPAPNSASATSYARLGPPALSSRLTNIELNTDAIRKVVIAQA